MRRLVFLNHWPVVSQQWAWFTPIKGKSFPRLCPLFAHWRLLLTLLCRLYRIIVAFTIYTSFRIYPYACWPFDVTPPTRKLFVSSWSTFVLTFPSCFSLFPCQNSFYGKQQMAKYVYIKMGTDDIFLLAFILQLLYVLCVEYFFWIWI